MERRVRVAMLGLALIMCVTGAHAVGGGAVLNVPGTYATINAALAAAVSGDTIQVAAGTYSEYVTINKSVTLAGANAGVPAANGTGTAPGGRAAETTITGGYFSPAASGITIDGLKFTGPGVRRIDSYASSDNLTITNCVFEFTTGHSGGGCIQLDTGSRLNFRFTHNRLTGGTGGNSYLYLGGGPWTGLNVNHNDFSTSTVYGFFGGGHTYGNPSFTDNYFTGMAAGINIGKLDNPTISGNTFTGMQLAFQIGTHGGTVTNNTISNMAGGSSRGIDLYGGQWTAWTCSGLSVTNNTISNVEWAGIYVRSGVEASITNNTVTDCGTGILLNLSGDIPTMPTTLVVKDNTIAGSGNVGFAINNLPGPLAEVDLGSTSIAAGYANFVTLTNTPIDVDATSAAFSGAATDAEKEARVYHDVDDAALGHVDWGQGAATACSLLVSNASGSVGDTVQLSAKLTAGGAPLAGQSVAFTVAGVAAGSGTTDGAGVATVNYPIATGGSKTIAASFSGVSNYQAATGTGTLTVNAAAPTSLTLVLNPTSVASGATTTCTVTGDNGVDYTSQCTYYAQYGAGGSFAANVYTAAKAGTWTLTAVYNTLSATAPLTVTPGAAATLSLSPATATINADGSQAYTVVATDAAGNTWTPAASCLGENGAGGFTDYTYSAAAGDAGTVVTITATLAPAAPVTATLSVNAAAGAGSILAWDKDTRAFYLCSNATNPQAGTLVNVSGTYGAYTLTVSGGGTNVTVTSADGSSLQYTWYLRSGALYRAYAYSRIGGVTKTATFDGTRTLVDGSWKTGFYGLTHTLAGAGVATYGSAKQ